MSIYDDDYWKKLVLAQKAIGIWPLRENNNYNKFSRGVVLISFCLLSTPIGIRMFQEIGNDAIIALENFIGIMYLSGGVIKFIMAICSSSKMRRIYEMISNDWKMTTDKEELKLLNKHAMLGHMIAVIYLSCFSFTLVIFVSLPVLYPLLDYVNSLENQTRSLALPYYAEYYIDQRKYYVPLMIKAGITGTIAMIVFVTYDMAFAMCVQHVCSLFDIIRLRLERISSIYSNTRLSNDDKVLNLIKKTIGLHQITVEYVNCLETSYNFTWLIIPILNSIALGSGTFLLTLKFTLIQNIVRYGMVFIALFIQKSFLFLIGQKIKDYSMTVFEFCYFCQWYDFSPKSKVLLRIIMARSIRPMYLTGGKMFILSMETYASMLKAAVSYFTIFAQRH